MENTVENLWSWSNEFLQRHLIKMAKTRTFLVNLMKLKLKNEQLKKDATLKERAKLFQNR